MSEIEEIGNIVQRVQAKHDAMAQDPEHRRLAEKQIRGEEDERKTREAQDLEERLSGAGVPRRIRDLLRDSLGQSRALQRVQQWHGGRPDESWCLVLSADKGAGKSVAAGWWLRELGACGYKPRHDGDTYGRWWTGTDLAVLDWYGGAAAAVASMAGPLVIDDLGTEFTDAKGFFQQRLDALIDARYREYRPTLITTNLSGRDFAQRYGQRVADRIREGGVFFEFNGKSMRNTGEIVGSRALTQAELQGKLLRIDTESAG